MAHSVCDFCRAALERDLLQSVGASALFLLAYIIKESHSSAGLVQQLDGRGQVPLLGAFVDVYFPVKRVFSVWYDSLLASYLLCTVVQHEQSRLSGVLVCGFANF